MAMVVVVVFACRARQAAYLSAGKWYQFSACQKLWGPESIPCALPFDRRYCSTALDKFRACCGYNFPHPIDGQRMHQMVLRWSGSISTNRCADLQRAQHTVQPGTLSW
uniref:Putative secreted protein n=1 Tax=Anopheles darlingi TaxID=43151 RepID=A0A2M4DE51_ANODA